MSYKIPARVPFFVIIPAHQLGNCFSQSPNFKYDPLASLNKFLKFLYIYIYGFQYKIFSLSDKFRVIFSLSFVSIIVWETFS
jgi:hypothetical protein